MGEIIFITKKPRPVLLFTVLLISSAALTGDFMKDHQFFNNLLIYLVIGAYLSITLIVHLLIFYHKITVFRDGIALKKPIMISNRYYKWKSIKSVKIDIRQPDSILIRLNSGKNRKFLLGLNIEDLIDVAYILYILDINVECLGKIKENWKEEAKELYEQGYFQNLK